MFVNFAISDLKVLPFSDSVGSNERLISLLTGNNLDIFSVFYRYPLVIVFWIASILRINSPLLLRRQPHEEWCYNMEGELHGLNTLPMYYSFSVHVRMQVGGSKILSNTLVWYVF